MSKKLEEIYEWLREPDDADVFDMSDLIDWANGRPVGKLRSVIQELKDEQK